MNSQKLSNAYKYYDSLGEKGYCGTTGSKAELTLRVNLMRDPRTKDYVVRKPGSPDLRLKIGGKFVDFEVKTGAGTIGYASCVGKDIFEDRLPDYCLLGKDIIFYVPCPSDSEDFDSLLDEGIALTREEFFSFLAENSGKRKKTFFTATKFNKGRKEIDIQTTYLQNFKEASESGCYDSIRQYLMDNGVL